MSEKSHKSHAPASSVLQTLARPAVMVARDMPADHFVEEHAHDWSQLAYSSDGLLAVYTENGSWMAPPERGVWIPAGTKHSCYTPHGAKFRSLHIDRCQFEDRMDLPDSCCVVSISPLMRELLRHAGDIPLEYDLDGPDGRVMGVIMDLLGRADQAPLHLPWPTDPRLARVTDALMEDPADPRGLEEFAAEAGASARTLARLFDKEMGMSFRAWRQQRRLLASLEMLAGGRPVTSVALDLGYDSPSAFIAMFKRVLGKSPTAYLSEGVA